MKNVYKLFLGVLFSITLCSCENFLNGSELKEEIDNAITYAETPDVSISVNCNNAYGTITSNSSGKYKLGKKDIEISFKESDYYQFVKWQVYNSKGEAENCTKEDAIYIKDSTLPSTTFDILKNASDYVISAECAQRPAVSIVSPQYQPSGVNRDRAIIINFNQNVDKTNFRYTPEEILSLDVNTVTLLKDSDDLAYGYIKNGIYHYKNLKIRNLNDNSENLLNYFGVPEVDGTKVTISPLKGVANQFKLDANGLKDIEVIISDSFANNGIKIKDEYVFSYRVTNSTDEQTRVTFTADSEAGVLLPSGALDYSVGAEIELTFTEKQKYKFLGWNISDSSSESDLKVAITKNSYNKETGICTAVFTVLEGGGNLQISPITALRPVVINSEPGYSVAGVDFDSNITIDFFAAVDKECFVYTQDEVFQYGSYAKAVYANPSDQNSDIIAVDVAGTRYFKNVSFLDDLSQNISNHYKALEFSEDRKTVKFIFDNTNLFDFENASNKMIYLTISKNICFTDSDNNKILMNDKGEDYNFSFCINKASSSKARVTFSAMNDGITMGTLNYSNTQSFNLGESVTVIFEPNADYEFVKWSVKGNSDGNLRLSEYGNKLTFTVAGAADNVEIAPVCEKLGSSRILFASNSGTVSPSGFVTCRRKDEISLISTVGSDYSFTRWQVLNTITNQVLSDEKASEYFYFNNVYSPNTTVKILQDNANLSIVAYAYSKPQVFSKSPEGLSSPVRRDSNIRIFVDQSVTKSTLYYSQDEAEELESKGYEILCQEKKEDGTFVEPYGYYLSESDLSSYVFKNVKITDNSTGENYLKYYEKPYISTGNDSVIIIPVKKVKDGSGKMIPEKNLPGNREIRVSLGTEYGFVKDGVVVGLNNVNLTWLYKTNDSFDDTVPKMAELSPSVLKASDFNQADKSFDILNGSSSSEQTTIPTDFDANWYKKYFVKTQNGEANINLEVNVVDDGSNLLSLSLIAEKLLNENYEKILPETTTKEFALPMNINGTNGTFVGTVNLRSKLSDGLYKLYYEVQDDVGNKITTDKTLYYYVFLDSVAPVDNKTMHFYSKNGKIVVDNINTNFTEKDINTVDSTITVNGTTIKCFNKADCTFRDLTNGQEYKVSIMAEDVFGNKAEYVYTARAGIEKGMIMYDNFYVSANKYSDLTVYGVVIESDYSLVKVAGIQTYLASHDNYGDLLKALTGIEPTGESGTKTSVVTKNGIDYTYRLPSFDEYKEIYELKDLFKALSNLDFTKNERIGDSSSPKYINFLVYDYNGKNYRGGDVAGTYYLTNSTYQNNNLYISGRYGVEGEALYDAGDNDDWYVCAYGTVRYAAYKSTSVNTKVITEFTD